MALNKDFRVKDSLYVGTSGLFAAGELSYNANSVAIDTYGAILSGGRDLANIFQLGGADNEKYESSYTTVNEGSGSWYSTYTSVNESSGSWDSVYASYNTASGSIIDTIAEGLAQGQIAVTSLDGTLTQVDVAGLQSADTPAFAGLSAGKIRIGITDDNTIDTNTGDLTINSATGNTIIDDNLSVTGDTTIQGSLSVIGSFTYLDTTVSVTSALDITNNGTGPALTVNQTGINDIADFKDDGVSVLFIADGGNIGLGTVDPGARLTVAGTLSAQSNANIDGNLTIGSYVDQYVDPTSSVFTKSEVFTAALTTSGNPNAVTTFVKSGLETAKYIISLYNGGSRTACEVLLVYNGTNAYGTVYGLVDAQGTSLLTDVDVSVSGSTVDLTISVSADCSATIHGVAHY